ncbi:MAG: hypothetical protein DDG59_01800 [Anaerolineae bacterium]|jgi:hypothetical protein|nr:MAG: hypothetical protein DDG59_01800 [Anaerolineae bacterium]
MKIAIVVPTIRQENITDFLQKWSKEFEDCTVIIVEDNPERSFDLAGYKISHFCWEDIDKELGSDSWIIPRRTDCVRSYGYYKAYQLGAEIIITLDDDCYPIPGGRFLKKHVEALNNPACSDAWVSTGSGVLPRGMPYQNLQRNLECVINHGLWTHIPDFDAVTQLVNSRIGLNFEPINHVIPRGKYFPMCGMNLAFARKVTPAMYFLLMGKDWPFDRFGDIWAGIFVKKICDHLGYGVKSGEPLIEHQRASNVWANLRKELPGYEVNETLWQAVDRIVLTKETFTECYKEIAEKLPLSGEYWDKTKRAMVVWTKLFEDDKDDRA